MIISTTMKSLIDTLITHIIKNIDPITFLSLDNGHLFTAFMEEPLSFANSNKKNNPKPKMVHKINPF